MPRVLVVEDDKDIAHLVGMHLKDEGYEVITVHDGADALDVVFEETFDLVVLDLMLPNVDGLELCRRIRARDSYTLVLMLTAKTSEVDRVLGAWRWARMITLLNLLVCGNCRPGLKPCCAAKNSSATRLRRCRNSSARGA